MNGLPTHFTVYHTYYTLVCHPVSYQITSSIANGTPSSQGSIPSSKNISENVSQNEAWKLCKKENIDANGVQPEMELESGSRQPLNYIQTTEIHKQKTQIQPKFSNTKKIRNKKQTRGYRQNSKRNFFSNLARLIVNFLNTEQRSSQYLTRMEVEEQKQKEFYRYMKKFKRSLDTYIKKITIYTLLGFQEIKEEPNQLRLKNIQQESEKALRSTIRRLTFLYLNELSIPVILRSKRMNKQNRMEHLALRRQLILAFSKATKE